MRISYSARPRCKNNTIILSAASVTFDSAFLEMHSPLVAAAVADYDFRQPFRITIPPRRVDRGEGSDSTTLFRVRSADELTDQSRHGIWFLMERCLYRHHRRWHVAMDGVTVVPR
jgi:hypothetical protein